MKTTHFLPTDATPAHRRDYSLMKRTRQKHRIYAWYSRTCTACNKPHIKQGDEIVRDSLGYAAPACISKRDSPKAIETRVKKLMLSLHNTALGTWDIPEGTTPTNSYAEFYAKALAVGLCSQHEVDVLSSNLAAIWTQQLWPRGWIRMYLFACARSITDWLTWRTTQHLLQKSRHSAFTYICGRAGFRGYS